MMSTTRKTPQRSHHRCIVCGKEGGSRQMAPWIAVRPGVSHLISTDHPDWQDGAFICRDDLSGYRRRYVENLIEEERGEIGRLEAEVVSSMEKGETVSRNVLEEARETMTFGEKLADAVAYHGGSWSFILAFTGFLLVWIGINVSALLAKPFDPYPFILLNLALSCVAALQAPVIMMSQRRQEAKDRLRSENDYRVNLKAELEIRQLHEKIDHQLAQQWERLAEIQQIQIELLEERSADRR